MVVVDKTIPDGERVVEKGSVTGRRVAVYRETYDKNNKLIEREKISEDIYQPVRGIIRVSPNYASFEQSETGKSDGLNDLQ